MTRRDLLRLVEEKTGREVVLLRSSGGHLIYQVIDWDGCRPGHESTGQHGLFVLSVSDTKPDRNKIEAVFRDLGLRGAWHE
jgi:hypothetical protein